MHHDKIGNGYCNDEANNPDCYYDGGDCCKISVNTDYCSECKCYHEETCIAGMNPLVQDGFCHDETNNEACNFDGGDCCTSCINSHYCSNCTCFGEVSLDEVLNEEVADGICNDEYNNAGCNYDGGDCCITNPNTDHCSECVCSTTGIIEYPLFPQIYDKFIELYWLIQVPSGKIVEFMFLRLEVDNNIHLEYSGPDSVYGYYWGTETCL